MRVSAARRPSALQAALSRDDRQTGHRPALDNLGSRRGAPRFRRNAVLPTDRRRRPASGRHAGPRRWRFAGRACLWSRDLYRRGRGTRPGLPRPTIPHRFDAGGCGVPARRPYVTFVVGGLLRLDPGGVDDPGGAFALAPHEAREVGLRHAHRLATVFQERGAHSRI